MARKDKIPGVEYLKFWSAVSPEYCQAMEEFKSLVTIVTYAVEGFGVVVIVAGSLVATARFLLRLRAKPLEAAYQEYRRVVGRSIILGLEFLIAGDVIRTVIVTHTMSSVAVLALIVVIRAFLSLTLAMEIEGRLPWKRAGTAAGCS